MKFFKFNLNFSHGAIPHCPQMLQWQLFLMNVAWNGKAEKRAYCFTGYWLDLAQIWYRVVFLDSKSKTNNKILI